MKNQTKKISKLDKIKMKALQEEFDMTLDEIGRLYDISRQRVHQIINEVTNGNNRKNLP